MKTSPPPVTATLSAVRSGIPGPLGLALACLVSTLAFANAQETETDTAKTSEPIPFDQIGAAAQKQYSGDAIGITATAGGIHLRAGFQKLEAQATHEGLWLKSTEKEGGRFRLVANSIGRNASDSQLSTLHSQLPPTVTVTENLVTFSRPLLTEEYSVSTDGIRQDFIVAERPAGNGDLRVELALKGASAESSAYGVKLTIDGSMRELAYSRLHVTDATGRELTASLEVLTSDIVIVRINDTAATYPVRIDPTFSDADWISMIPGQAGTNGDVRAAVVDGSGNLYIAGNFSAVGAVKALRIAKWDGSTWSALGTGISDRDYGTGVFSMAASGTDLYVGGVFQSAGGVLCLNIAKWNGVSWSALGAGINNGSNPSYPSNAPVYALAVSGSDVYAGGDFATAGGAAANRIAKWNGVSWSALGAGMGTGYALVKALAVSGSDLYAGGQFSTAGGVATGSIAKWNGSVWSGLGTPTYDSVNALALDGSGNLYAGGGFTSLGEVAANRIAKWNGVAWTGLGTGMNNQVFSLAVNGTDLYVGGRFTTAGGVAANRIAKWNGASWSALGTGMSNDVNALVFLGSNLYASASFYDGSHIKIWNGSSWASICDGMDGPVYATAVDGANLYIGGHFTTVGGVAANSIAKWNGSVWSGLGSGVSGSGKTVYALLPIGTDLYVAGAFTTAGGVAASCVAKWNGSVWSALGTGVNDISYSLAASGSNIYVGGRFTTAGGAWAGRIAKWNGSVWSELGSGIDNNNVLALVVDASGTLYAGGDFTAVGSSPINRIAKWNGSTWSAMGTGMNNTVYALALMGSELYAGGYFATAGGVTVNGIAKWNGSAWSGLGSGMSAYAHVQSLAVTGTELYVGGSFSSIGGMTANSIARWNGSAWEPLGSGLDGSVFALAIDSSHHLFAGGNFFQAGTTVSPYLVQANLSASASLPEIAIEQPLTSNVPDGGTRDFGSVALGANSSLTFTIKNTGDADLTGLAITKDGTDSGDFSITASPTAPVTGPSGSTTFTVRFSPIAAGTKTAAVHIASNDADENPFDIILTGYATAPPVISIQPVGSSIYEGETASLTVSASGGGPLAYQWYSGQAGDTTNPVGINSATLTTGNLFATTSFWVRVSNSFGSVDSTAATITLLPSKPAITSASVAYGRQNTTFTHQITATRNPTSYGAVNLPSGLSLNASTGLISGLPLVNGAFVVTLSAQNSEGTGQQELHLEISPPLASIITSPLFAAAAATLPFSYQLTATNPWFWFEIQNGPAWLSLNPNTGVLSGTPTVPGTVTVQVRASGSGQSAWSTLSISVSPHPDAPVITSLAEVSGRRGEFLTFQITASPAATSYGIAGALPSGIVLNATSGLISGVPSVEGTFNVTITASNASGLSIAAPFRIVLWPPWLVPVISSGTSFVVNLGTSFSTTVLATNSPLSFTFQNLPLGLLQIGTTGQISGTMATPGIFAFSVRATNFDGSGPTQNMVLRVRYNPAAPVVTVSTVASGYVGIPYSYNIPVSTTTTLFTAVGLPPGITLASATGVISGTPTAIGSFDVTLQASNAAGMGEPRIVTFTIAPSPNTPEIVGSLMEETTALSPFSYQTQSYSVLPVTGYLITGLPDGMTANPATGAISGAASITGVFEVKLRAFNAVGAGAERILNLVVRAGGLLPKITSAPSVTVYQGASMVYQITATNSPIHGWQASGLPDGLSLNATTGSITGKPVIPGTFHTILRASNANGAGDPLTLQILVKPNVAVPVMVTQSDFHIVKAQPIEVELQATNLPSTRPWPSGTGIYAENLPDGMSLNQATGVMSGEPLSTVGFQALLTPTPYPRLRGAPPLIPTFPYIEWYVRTVGLFATNETGRGPTSTITIYYKPSYSTVIPPAISGPKQLSWSSGQPLNFRITTDVTSSAFEFCLNTGYSLRQAGSDFSIPATTIPLPGRSSYDLRAYRSGILDNPGSWGYLEGLPLSVAPASGAPQITNSNVIYATAGVPVSTGLTASGVPGRFEITTVSPAWPSGLLFNVTTGVFSGTVSQAGVISFLARAYNATGASLPKEISMVFSPPAGAPTITTGGAFASGSALKTEAVGPMSAPLPPLSGQVGVAFTHQFQATGNVIRFEITGLPEGLVYNENTGEVSGESVEPGHFDLIVTPIGISISGQPVTIALLIEPAAGTPEITSQATAAAVAGTAFTWQFTASATPAGYNLAELPAWLVFNPFTGNLSGTPGAPGDTKLQISGFNALGEGLAQEFTIHATAAAGTPVVNPPAGSFPGRVGVAFNASISAAGTVNFYDASALPFGISLDAQTGVFSGIPVEPGTHVVQVWGVNAQGTGESRAVTFAISPAVGTPAFSGETVLRAIEGQEFSHLITTAPAATAFSADGLPSGWSFNPLSGLLQATPLLGNYDLEIEAWNAAGSSGKQSFQVRVFADAKELWLDEKFGDQAGNPAVAGWTADPDRDGVSNLLEYAFGLNPNSGASMQFPPAQRVAGNFIVSFPEPAGISGITYGAEWSPTMEVASWLPVPDTGSGGGHTFSVPIGAQARMFMRLKVTNP